MATYFVSASGSNTAPYDTWAKAATSLQTALTAATANDDIVVIQHNNIPSTDKEVSAARTWTAAGNISIVSASNDGGSAYTPTAMGTANWLGNSTASFGLTIAGGFAVYFYGVTFRTAGGSSAGSITLVASDDAYHTMEQCYFWIGTSNGSASLTLFGNSSLNNLLTLRDSTVRFGNASQSCKVDGGHFVFEKVDLDTTDATPTTLVVGGTTRAPSGGVLHGCDLSAITGTLIGGHTAGTFEYWIRQCRLGAGVTVMGTQAVLNPSCIKGVHVLDSSSSNLHYIYEFHNALGSLTLDTGIYANDGLTYDGTNRLSWKIVTTANANRNAPFVTPWITKYNTDLTAKTLSLEMLRDGSATAFTDGEVWGEFSAKVTAGSTRATIYQDRRVLGGTPVNQGAGVGLAGWTGEQATAWSGKLATLTTVTPTAVGDIAARVAVARPSTTLYVDPQIRSS